MRFDLLGFHLWNPLENVFIVESKAHDSRIRVYFWKICPRDERTVCSGALETSTPGAGKGQRAEKLEQEIYTP